jgi:hypothetical protein
MRSQQSSNYLRSGVMPVEGRSSTLAKGMEAGKNLAESKPDVIALEGYQHNAKKVQRLQKSLYLAAKEQGRKFYSLYDKVSDWDVMVEAWKQVKANGGSGGIDGIEIEDLKTEVECTPKTGHKTKDDLS